jgi:hypothetical protein
MKETRRNCSEGRVETQMTVTIKLTMVWRAIVFNQAKGLAAISWDEAAYFRFLDLKKSENLPESSRWSFNRVEPL